MADTITITWLHADEKQQASIRTALMLGHRVYIVAENVTSPTGSFAQVVASPERYPQRECPLCARETPGNRDECTSCEQSIGFGEPLVAVPAPVPA